MGKSKSNEPEEYEVERVLGKKIKNGEIYYLIKWVGYSEEQNTWEPSRNCQGAKHLIEHFEKTLTPKQKPLASKSRPKEQNEQKENLLSKSRQNLSRRTQKLIKLNRSRKTSSITVSEVNNISGEGSILNISRVEKDVVQPSSSSLDENTASTNSSNDVCQRISSILDCNEDEVEILGIRPEDDGIKIGVRRKINEDGIHVFSSSEIKKRWPRLLIAFYEDKINFEV